MAGVPTTLSSVSASGDCWGTGARSSLALWKASVGDDQRLVGRFHNYSFGNILEIARQNSMQPASLASMRGISLVAWLGRGRRISASSPP